VNERTNEPASSIVERFTTRSGVRIRYLDNAPADPIGAPIIFAPGFTDFADEYLEVLDFFAPRRMIVIEVRGRGGSESPPTGYRAADHASDLRAVIDEEGIEHYHLMTYSRGTTWGLDLALAQPSQVVSVSIGDYWAREFVVPRERAELVYDARFRGRPMSERVKRHVITELFKESENRDMFDALAATGLPVLLATGTKPDCILSPETVEEYRQRIPHVEIVTIEGSGHDLFRLDRLAYPRALKEFIQRRTQA
jgi:non-heme chloroperoxidase